MIGRRGSPARPAGRPPRARRWPSCSRTNRYRRQTDRLDDTYININLTHMPYGQVLQRAWPFRRYFWVREVLGTPGIQLKSEHVMYKQVLLPVSVFCFIYSKHKDILFELKVFEARQVKLKKLTWRSCFGLCCIGCCPNVFTADYMPGGCVNKLHLQRRINAGVLTFLVSMDLA